MNVRRLLILLIVFVGGITTMGVEMSASRLLDPYFGNSLIIWAVLIGTVLLYLTVGYYIGGKWADRRPHGQTLYQITVWAAFLLGLVPLIARPVLAWSMRGFAEYSAGILAGSLLGVVLLFSVPITLLGCVSPFAIRLAVTDVGSAGKTAGGLYALSTVGSLVGTFLPVLALIPAIGTRNTFFLLAFLLMAVSLAGLFWSMRAKALPYLLMPLVLIALILLFPAGLIKPTEYGELIWEGESSHNYIQVVQVGDEVWLRLNEGQGCTRSNPNGVLVGGIWDYL